MKKRSLKNITYPYWLENIKTANQLRQYLNSLYKKDPKQLRKKVFFLDAIGYGKPVSSIAIHPKIKGIVLYEFEMLCQRVEDIK